MKVALGTVQFGLDYGLSNQRGQTSSEEVAEILKEANKLGISTLDTASAYGNSEEVLGKSNIKGFNIVTKFIANGSEKELMNQFSRSCFLLNTKNIYGYLAHRSEDLLSNPKIWMRLNDLKQNGQIEKIGCSLYSPNELKALEDVGIIPDIIQVPYNILDQKFKKICEQKHDEGIEIHIRSLYLQGLFFMPAAKLPSFFNEIKPWLKEFQSSFSTHNEIANFLLQEGKSQKWIDRIVIGVNNKEQLLPLALVNPINIKTPKIPVFNAEILNPANWPKTAR